MIPCFPIESALQTIHELDRERCIHELTHFEAIPLDFERSFLDDMSDDRLRHLLAAALITAHRRDAGYSARRSA